MIERLGEGINRYNNTFKQKYSPSKLKSMVNYTQEIEKQIFKHCAIKPADITEVKVKPLINKLRDYNIETRWKNNQNMRLWKKILIAFIISFSLLLLLAYFFWRKS